jgi:hypothetical protein
MGSNHRSLACKARTYGGWTWLDVPGMASASDCGWTWPDTGRHWLPVWLPRFVSAANLPPTRTEA